MKPQVVLRFPLRGEWMAINTPAERVPSHGTDYFGQRYAYDFVRPDEKKTKFQRNSTAWAFIGLPSAKSFYAWDQPVHSAGEGKVIAVGDGWPDRMRVNVLLEMGRATFAPTDVNGTDYRPLAGNYVMIQGEGGVAFYAHLRNGSVKVRVGETVSVSQIIGRVGNSGNTTMPHLHFHVMDGADPLKARGVLCAFRGYERLENDSWVKETEGLPGPMERIRSH